MPFRGSEGAGVLGSWGPGAQTHVTWGLTKLILTFATRPTECSLSTRHNLVVLVGAPLLHEGVSWFDILPPHVAHAFRNMGEFVSDLLARATFFCSNLRGNQQWSFCLDWTQRFFQLNKFQFFLSQIHFQMNFVSFYCFWLGRVRG